MNCKVGGFVVGIPAVMVNERVAPYYADTDFYHELDLGLGFAADYWPDMGLMDADYAVFTHRCPVFNMIGIIQQTLKDSNVPRFKQIR